MKPEWLKIKLEGNETFPKIRRIVETHRLHTICSSGRCPNIGRCWSRGTATFMILGDICTRSCRFCATQTGRPMPPDANEPQKVAESIRLMQLKHCVITSVDRDDLPDKGAEQWVKTIRAVREQNPHIVIEVLIPDFDADAALLHEVVTAQPDIIGHNLETVARLTPLVRSRAGYGRSLEVLRYVAQQGVMTKSGIMVGLGEQPEEVVATMHDACDAGVRLFTIGQYLQPTARHIPVAEYVPPSQFDSYKRTGMEIGFKNIESAPLVRSSFMAAEQLR
ncbi:MAG: lipoyl synthase [Prevotellaceae bacterium]|jgi:lipoic acid synthetase|nr:lipoyl synthase [Prevotellaceae bacterium]